MAGKVKNKGVGATLKVNTSDAIKNITKLANALAKAGENLKDFNGKDINLNVNLKPFQQLQLASKETMTKITKTFADTSKQVQNSLNQNMISTPLSGDFTKRLRDNLREAQQITAEATAKIQASLNSSLMVGSGYNKGILSSFDRTSISSMLDNIGGTGRNLSETLRLNQFKLIEDATSAVNVGRIAQIGEAFDTVNDALAAVDAGKIAQIGNAFTSMEGLDTMNFVRSAEAIREIGEVSDALDLAEMVRNLDAIERSNAFIQMADQAQAARERVVALGKGIQNVGKLFQSLGSGIMKLGQGIQNYSNYMIKGFMAMQYTLRGVIDAAVGGTSDLISGSIEQIKSLEQATIGFQNYFGKKESGFDPEIFLERIKQEAIIAQGVNAGDLASYISQVAPVASSSDQAFDVTLGLLKAITYSGGNASQEMPNVVRNIRDVLAKGQAYAMDINQFNRAIPGLPNILGEMGLTQFLKNDQLVINKNNIDQVMAAFAKFNDPSSPVYDILERMADTLGGAQEMFKETIIQSVSSSIEQSGLLDIWKNMLKNADLQSAIQNSIDSLIRTVAKFLEDVGIEHLITEVMNMVGKLSEYFGQTIVPALKQLFGLDEGASMREVVDNVINLIGEFGKGLINGIQFLINGANWIKEHILPVIQSLGETLGISGNSVAEWAGFLVTAAPLLSPLVKVIGAVTKAFGSLLGIIAKEGVKRLMKSDAETLFSNSKITELLSGSGGSFMSKLFSSNGLKGLGIVGVGHLFSGVVGNMFGGVNTASGKLADNITKLGSTFAGLSLSFSPLVGAAGAATEALLMLAQEQSDYAKQLHQEKVDAMKASFDKLQNFYLDSTIASLRSAGFFHEGENATQQAYEELIKFISEQNYDSTASPEKIMSDFVGQYMKSYGYWKAGDNLLDTTSEWLDPQSDSYITGYTKMTKDLANQYNEQLRAVYERMLELGFVGTYDKYMENYDPYDLWKHLYKGSQNFGSLEFLQKVYGNLNDPAWLKDNIASIPVEFKYKADGTDMLFDDYQKGLNAAGFTPVDLGDGRVAWQDMATLRIFVDADTAKEGFEKFKEMEQEFFDENEKLLNGRLQFGENLNNYDLSTPFKADQDTKAELYDDLTEAKEIVTLFDLIKKMFTSIDIVKKSTGGYVRPVYRANGGMERGVDTVPAMLAPGEFVQRSSAVSLAGLGVMEALNHGDLGAAYRLLGAKISHNVNNNNSRTISNTDSHNTTQNFIMQHFHNRSGGIGGMRKVGALLSRR